ncbi:MAG: cyclic nucleotide-binding domain-containing protein [Bdellovibrio sp.]|nr:cyclic nucleotide-binding domain-containing protein [Bdellovibrio sp.]
MCLFFAVLFTSFEAPYSLAIKSQIHQWQLWVDGVISLLFMADLFYYIIQEKKRRKDDRPKTHMDNIKHQTNLLLSFISSIPFDIVIAIFGLNSLHILRLIRLYRLMRLPHIFHTVGDLAVIPGWFKAMMAIVGATIGTHIFACLWMMVYPNPGDMSKLDYYIRSLYYVVTTLSTVGYGDITPPTTGGRLLAMLTMMVGVGIFGIIIGNITRYFSEADRYKELNREKIQDLTNFMRHYEVPIEIQEVALNYYGHLLAKRLSDNDDKIIAELPASLQEEMRTYMNVKLIGGLSIFQNCTAECLKTVAQALEQKYFSPGQQVISKGEIGHEMFIIGHGSVNVTLDNVTVLATLNAGHFFGESALLEEAPRNAHVVASDYCDLYKLDKNDFINIIKRYPELYRNIEAVISKRKVTSNSNRPS